MSTGLDEFQQHLIEVSRIAAWVLPTAGLAPIIASLVNLNPPWPNPIGLTAATCAAVLFTLVAVFQFLDSRKLRRVNLTMSFSLALGVATTIIYFSLFGVFVFKPVGGDAFAKGFQCTQEALQVFGPKCPWLDVDELRSVAFEETRLWTIKSIVIARVVLVLLWMGMFTCLSVCLGAFVRYQSRRKSSQRS